MHHQEMNERVIAHLSRKNLELNEKIKDLEEIIKSINGILYCIGGPLNDNVLNYSKEQLMTFFKIGELIKNIELEN